LAVITRSEEAGFNPINDSIFAFNFKGSYQSGLGQLNMPKQEIDDDGGVMKYKKWKRWDSAFVWGVMTRYPNQYTLLELIFDSELELKPLHSQALVGLSGQLGVHVDWQERLDPTPELVSTPTKHCALISFIISRAFEEPENQRFRLLFAIGRQFGDLITTFDNGDFEDDNGGSWVIQSQIKNLPTEFHSAFYPLGKFIEQVKESELRPEDFLGGGRVSITVYSISSNLKRVRHEGIDPKRADLDDAVCSYGCVQLRPQKESPNAYVDGVAAGTLPTIAYSVVEALVDAREIGLTKEQLTTKSEAEDGYGTFRQLKEKEPWNEVLVSPGGKGKGGYRILDR